MAGVARCERETRASGIHPGPEIARLFEKWRFLIAAQSPGKQAAAIRYRTTAMITTAVNPQ